MFYVYILKSKSTGRYYIGQTNNIRERLKKHNLGKTKSTKYGIPWQVVYSEEFKTRTEVMKRENEIKSYKGGNAFRNLLK